MGQNDEEDEARLCFEALMQRILVFSDYAWERRINQEAVERWLANFDGRSGLPVEIERLHALYLLSQFLYFGVREIRVLLRALYRDLFLIPLIQEIRTSLGGTRDMVQISNGFAEAMRKTRFLGVGNPSESGVHLLYYFRQENGLSKHHFLDAAQIFSAPGGVRQIRDPDVERYIFLDDVCGSGDTACEYSRLFLAELMALKPTAKVAYHCIFGTSDGLKSVRDNSVFADQARAIFELDESYKSLSPSSRYFKIRPVPIDSSIIAKLALYYGELVAPGHGGGWNGDQLLLGFSHNIPDNTLPIIWRDSANGAPVPWTAALRRYMKV